MTGIFWRKVYVYSDPTHHIIRKVYLMTFTLIVQRLIYSFLVQSKVLLPFSLSSPPQTPVSSPELSRCVPIFLNTLVVHGLLDHLTLVLPIFVLSGINTVNRGLS